MTNLVWEFDATITSAGTFKLDAKVKATTFVGGQFEFAGQTYTITSYTDKDLTSADGHSVTYWILDDDEQSWPDLGMPQPILSVSKRNDPNHQAFSLMRSSYDVNENAFAEAYVKPV